MKGAFHGIEKSRVLTKNNSQPDVGKAHASERSVPQLFEDAR